MPSPRPDPASIAFAAPASLTLRSAFSPNHACPALHSRSIRSLPVFPSPSPVGIHMTHAVPATSPDGDLAISPPQHTATATLSSTPSITAPSPADPGLAAAQHNGTDTAHIPVTVGSMHLSMNEISELIEVVDQADLADFRYEHEGFSIEITRTNGLGFDEEGNLNALPEPQRQQVADPAYVEQAPIETSTVVQSHDHDQAAIETTVSDETADQLDDKSGTSPSSDEILDSDFVVTSNRVGFFFSGAKNKPPLVNVGDVVAYNQPVCIIEQLGQQYVYLSEASGKVVKLFVEDGDAVEYGTQIMVIRPD